MRNRLRGSYYGKTHHTNRLVCPRHYALWPVGHAVQDAVPCHESALTREWHGDKLKADRKATARKQKLEKYNNRSTRSLEPLNVGDFVSVQNAVAKR